MVYSIQEQMRRRAIVVKMILSPLMPYGMGLESLDEVGYEICIR